MSDTLLINRSQVIDSLQVDQLIEPLRAAFISHSLERVVDAQRIPAPLPGGSGSVGPNSAMILVPGVTPGIPAYSVKVHAKFPGQKPAIRGVILLHDLESGALLAIMDSTYITAVRTGISAALATHHLAATDSATVAVIGAGIQGEYQLRYLADMRPLAQVHVYDVSPERAAAYAAQMSTELELPVTVTPTVDAAMSQAEIVLTATWATQPFIFPHMVRPGMHITTLGPDQPGKCEVDAAVIQQSRFICDDRALAVQMGAIAGAGLDASAIAAELGEVFAATAPGRTSADQVTVFGSVGLAWQDLVVAWQVYRAVQTSSSSIPSMNFII